MSTAGNGAGNKAGHGAVYNAGDGHHKFIKCPLTILCAMPNPIPNPISIPMLSSMCRLLPSPIHILFFILKKKFVFGAVEGKFINFFYGAIISISIIFYLISRTPLAMLRIST